MLNLAMAMFRFQGTEKEWEKFTLGFWIVFLFATAIILLGLAEIAIVLIQIGIVLVLGGAAIAIIYVQVFGGKLWDEDGTFKFDIRKKKDK